MLPVLRVVYIWCCMVYGVICVIYISASNMLKFSICFFPEFLLFFFFVYGVSCIYISICVNVFDFFFPNYCVRVCGKKENCKIVEI